MESGKKYLANGREVRLEAKANGKYYVREVYQDYDGGDIIDDDIIVVGKVYDTPPTEKISKEVAELENEKFSLKEKLFEIRKELGNSKKELEHTQKTILEKKSFIVNKSEFLNAEKIVVFLKDKVMPIEIGEKEGYGISCDVFFDGKEQHRTFSLLKDYYVKYTICTQSSILIDPKKDELKAAIQERLNRVSFTDYQISSTPDEYLSEDLLRIKKGFINEKKENLVKNLKRQKAELERKLQEAEKELI